MNPEGRVAVDAFRGGCQCGAVRYAVAAGPARQTVCHCRMCQRATGNAFAPLVEVGDDRIAWTGRPGTFRSSSIAERGFCPACGTPLFYRRPGVGTTELMAGTIEPPFAYAPVANHGIESRQPWLLGLAALPGRETVFTGGEQVVSHQWEYRA